MRAAELIAAELGVEPQITQAPSLVGEVTHYVADIRKARDLLGWEPKTPLDEGIPRAVAWFREWRAAHPEEDRPLAAEAPTGSSTASSSRAGAECVAASSRSSGPTATGKPAVARRSSDRLDAEVVSADSAALYAGLPVLTAAPDYPARLVGVVPLDEDVSVGEYQRLAHAAIDEILAAGRTPVVVGGTGLYLRAALVVARAAAAARTGRARALGRRLRRARRPRRRTRCSPSATPRRPRACTRTTAAASCARSSWPRRARRSRRREDRLWADDMRHPTTLVGLDLDRGRARPPDRGARRARWSSAASSTRRARAWARPLSETARKVLGLEEFATLPLDEAVEAVVARDAAGSPRYQRKWLRRLPGRRYARRRPPTGGDRR